jgi:hypothetical protein
MGPFFMPGLIRISTQAANRYWEDDEMKSLIQILVLAALILAGSWGPALAGDAPKGAEKNQADIKLKQNEIKGSLKDIVGSMNLDKTEIMGDVLPDPNMSYNRPWSQPEPFPSDTKDLSRGLIDQAYNPVDRDSLVEQVDIISGPGGGDAGSLPETDLAATENDLSSFISYANPE